MGKEKAQKIKWSKEPTTPYIKGDKLYGQWEIHLPESKESQLTSIWVGKHYAGIWGGWRKDDKPSNR